MRKNSQENGLEIRFSKPLVQTKNRIREKLGPNKRANNRNPRLENRHLSLARVQNRISLFSYKHAAY